MIGLGGPEQCPIKFGHFGVFFQTLLFMMSCAQITLKMLILNSNFKDSKLYLGQYPTHTF